VCDVKLSKSKLLSLLLILCITLTLSISVSAKTINKKGMSWDETCTDGLCTRTLYSGIINYYDGQRYVPINTTITSSTHETYDYEMSKGIYTAYFQDNINTGEAVKFVKDDYYFIYDLSGGKMQWAVENKTGVPDWGKTKSIGGIIISPALTIGNKIYYNNSFVNTNLEYYLYNEMLKENFVLNNYDSLVDGADYVYLEYTGEIRFSEGLTIWADGEQQDKSKGFNTTGRIDLKDVNGTTIFYLASPIATDDNGSVIGLRYDVKPGTTKFAFHLQTPRQWLSEATYPVRIDPTIKLQSNISENLGDTEVAKDAPTTNYGTSTILEASHWNSLFPTTNYHNEILIKFNISLLPSSVTITNSTLYLKISGNQLDSGDSYTISNYHVYPFPTYNISNIEWNETSITWNNRPNQTTQTNTTKEDDVNIQSGAFGWKAWSCTKMLSKATTDNNPNITIRLNVTSTTGTVTEDEVYFYSKETATSTNRPYLNITYIDNTIPNITLISPPNNNWNTTSTPNFFFNVSDNETSSNCSLWINNSRYGENQSVKINVTTNITTNTSFADNTSYHWWINCTDNSANEKKSSVWTLNIDTTNPTLIVNTPTNDTDYTNTTILFNITTTDNLQRDSCKYEIINYTSGSSHSNGSLNCNLTNVSLPIGTFNISISVNDTAGNTNTTTISNITASVDDSNPNITITNPQSSFEGMSFNLAGTVTDNVAVAKCWYRFNSTGDTPQTNTSMNCSGGTYSVSESTNSFGSHEILVYANDTSGNIGMSSKSFINGEVGGGGGGGGSDETKTCTINVIKPSISMNVIGLTGKSGNQSPWQDLVLQNMEAYPNTYSFNFENPICEAKESIIVIEGQSQGTNQIRCYFPEKNTYTNLLVRCEGSSLEYKVNLYTDLLSRAWANPIILIVGLIIIVILIMAVISFIRLIG